MAGKLRPSILYIVFSLGMQRERENIFLKIKSVIVCMSLWFHCIYNKMSLEYGIYDNELGFNN